MKAECIQCHEVKCILSKGMCCRCYWNDLESRKPGSKETNRAYMREYQRNHRIEDTLPTPVERLRIICWPPIFTISDWLEFIVQSRKINKREQLEPTFADGRRRAHHSVNTRSFRRKLCTHRAS
jgi:hypothetical protein